MTLPSCVRFHRYDLQKLPGNLSDDAVVKPHLQHGVEIRLHDALAEFFEVYDPDLRRFRDHDGKMIAWEGNADTAAGPYALLNYYQKVRDALGGSEKTRDTMRLFILPGVYHCRGGYMPYEANFLGAIVNWVEAGSAPDSIEATAVKPDGALRIRPLFAYPMVTQYSGRGDPERPESFIGQWPKREPNDHFDWAAGK